MRVVTRRAWSAVVLLGTMTAVGGCVPVVLGGGVLAVNAATQDRGIGGSISDAELQTKLNDVFLRNDEALYSRVNFTIDQGRVLMTGRVVDQQMKAQASRLAFQASGVKEVINELMIDDESGLSQRSADTWITTRLRTALVTDGGIWQNNYSIVTVNGVVFLIGSAQNQAELDKVLQHARGIPDVRRVVSYVRV